MRCPRCNHPIANDQQYCFCGFNFLNADNSKITANEEFIYHNTRTSHKLYESMVMYALHFALRDVQLVSQYHVSCNGFDYYLDGYFPAIKLAIEIDEPHHEQQIEVDNARQNAITEKLGCEFIRISCTESIYQQVDKIVERIKSENLPPWSYQRPQPNARTGEFSASHWSALTHAEIPEMMDAFMAFLELEGHQVEIGNVRGIPSPSNGEYGFLFHYQGYTLSIFARKTGKVRIIVMIVPNDANTDMLSQFLEPRQIKDGKARYYELKEYPKGLADKVQAKKVLDWFLSCSLFDNALPLNH